MLIMNDASMDAKFDDFAKRDGLTDQLTKGQTEQQSDGATDRHTGSLGCNGRIQKRIE